MRSIRKYRSHPDRYLQDHIKGVCSLATGFFDHPCTRTAALLHDIGKLNELFQKYRLELKIKSQDIYTNHAYLGLPALFCYLRANGCKPGIIRNHTDFLLTAICIIKHHGSIPNLDKLLNKEELEKLKKFLEEYTLPVSQFLSYIGFDKNLNPFSVEWVPMLESQFSHKSRIKKLLGTTRPLDFYLDLKGCFSAIVSADKLDAGRHELKDVKKRRKKFMSTYHIKINDYIKGLKNTKEIDSYRTEIRKACTEKLKTALQTKKRVFSLTEPTGTGKTSILIEGYKIIAEYDSSINKAIYSVPYLTLTEQIFGIIDGIFKDPDNLKRIDSKAPPEEEYDPEDLSLHERNNIFRKIKTMFLKITGKTLNNDQISKLLKDDFLESTFGYSFIVTTFVQFFQTFTTASNKGLMRLAHFRNSVFLIDEIQTIPPTLYAFFIALINAFCHKFNCYCIVSTATMPNFNLPPNSENAKKFFYNYTPPIEIGNSENFKKDIFNRYRIIPIKNECSIEEHCDRVLQGPKSNLIVLNTVNDSKAFYKCLKNKNDCPIYLINARKTPHHRRKILDICLKLIKEEKKFVLVSTQVIEAGVDIDFHSVHTDIAPLPNIIQRAGRGNRNGQYSMANIYVFKLRDEYNLRASYIYCDPDTTQLNYACEILFGEKEHFQEKEMYDLQKKSFQDISENLLIGKWQITKENKDSGKKYKSTCNMINQIEEFQYGDLGSFNLIPKKEWAFQHIFYVPFSDNDKNYEKLQQLMAELYAEDEMPSPSKDSIKEILKKRVALKKHLRKIMDRVIQVRIDKNSSVDTFVEYPDECYGILKLKREYYSKEYGFNEEGDLS